MFSYYNCGSYSYNGAKVYSLKGLWGYGSDSF